MRTAEILCKIEIIQKGTLLWLPKRNKTRLL
jgi:hypothetical protein